MKFMVAITSENFQLANISQELCFTTFDTIEAACEQIREIVERCHVTSGDVFQIRAVSTGREVDG